MKNNFFQQIIGLNLFSRKRMTQGVENTNQEMSFQEIDRLWNITSYLKNEAPEASHVIYYDGGTDELHGIIRYFKNTTDNYEVTMFVVGMPREIRVSIQLIVNRKYIDIPNLVSYQEYDNPKMIHNKIVIRSHSGVHSQGDHFYTIIGGEDLDNYSPSYYFTKRLAQIEHEEANLID